MWGRQHYHSLSKPNPKVKSGPNRKRGKGRRAINDSTAKKNGEGLNHRGRGQGEEMVARNRGSKGKEMKYLRNLWAKGTRE